MNEFTDDLPRLDDRRPTITTTNTRSFLRSFEHAHTHAFRPVSSRLALTRALRIAPHPPIAPSSQTDFLSFGEADKNHRGGPEGGI